MKDIPEKIAKLILVSSQRELVEEERKILKDWLLDDSENKGKMEELLRLFENYSLIEIYKNIGIDDNWRKVELKTKHLPGWKQVKTVRIWRMAAAVFIPFLLITGIWFYIDKEKENQASSGLISQIEPGAYKAFLELDNGEIIALNEDNVRNLTDKEGTALGKDSVNTLILSSPSGKKEIFNTIHVPLGGEYRLVLSDGTQAWINSGSNIRFPVTFGSDKREIELSGEAFFEVIEDKNRPFVVKTKKSEVRVLGTSFNIASYDEDVLEKTTLVTGSVEIDFNDKKYVLTPGKQIRLNSTDLSVEVETVDVQYYTSWKDGIFRFLDMPLDELAVRLERWYNVSFVFEDKECEKIRFTGAINRSTDFSTFIRMIESTTEVCFRIDNEQVVISKLKDNKRRMRTSFVRF